ncbi:MAG: HpcH/HpaI aldolase family protein [Chloroflexota bacterium]
MAETPRLNGVIAQLEQGKTATSCFATPSADAAVTIATTKYDSVVWEMEHNPYNVDRLRDTLQYMLNRRQIVQGGTLAPAVTPIVRIPPNGLDMTSWIAKQVLDLGVYGIVWPHTSTVDEALNAVRSCRYPRPEGSPLYNPPGYRGDAPAAAVRYWGIGGDEYYKKADVWPLNPEGEVLCIVMIEEKRAVENLPRMLKEVPGISIILIGEGDLSQDLGHPREYDHPIVHDHIRRVVDICNENGVVCGHPHVDTENVGWIVDAGFRFLMAAPTTSYAGLQKSLELTGRA